MEDRYGRDKEFVATGIILVVILISFGVAHADDATGLPQDDPKDVSSQQAEAAPCPTGEFFLPIPSGSRAAELFDRYRHEAQSPAPAALARRSRRSCRRKTRLGRPNSGIMISSQNWKPRSSNPTCPSPLRPHFPPGRRRA
jgi:hypothetical protein